MHSYDNHHQFHTNNDEDDDEEEEVEAKYQWLLPCSRLPFKHMLNWTDLTEDPPAKYYESFLVVFNGIIIRCNIACHDISCIIRAKIFYGGGGGGDGGVMMMPLIILPLMIFLI